jgi:hypothetical protein
VSVWELFDLSLPLLPQFTRTGIVLGLLATAVFVAMLATSTDRAQRALGRNWKRLHRLVWFAVPLALAHTILASGLDSPSIVLYLGIMASRGSSTALYADADAGGVDTPDADRRRGVRGGPDLRRAVAASLGNSPADLPTRAQALFRCVYKGIKKRPVAIPFSPFIHRVS